MDYYYTSTYWLTVHSIFVWIEVYWVSLFFAAITVLFRHSMALTCKEWYPIAEAKQQMQKVSSKVSNVTDCDWSNQRKKNKWLVQARFYPVHLSMEVQVW